MQATAKEAKLPSIKKGKKNFSVFPFVNGLFFLLFCLFILVPLWKVLVDSLDRKTSALRAISPYSRTRRCCAR